jgi:flagellar protein FlhE
MRKWLWILFFPLAAQAAGEGMWQASSMGVTLSNRGVPCLLTRCHR